MDAGKRQWIVVIFALAVGLSDIASANQVRTYGGDFHLQIPADPNNTNSTKGWMDDAIIDIADHFTIYDLDVRITATHTKVFDLQLFLQSPTGARLCLNMYNPSDEYFDGENYTQTIFDDEAETPIENGQPPFTGSFRPEAGSLLSIFDGMDAYGCWRLQIYDAYFANSGTLEHFELTFEIPEPFTVLLLILGAPLMRKILRCRRRPSSLPSSLTLRRTGALRRINPPRRRRINAGDG